MSTHSGVSDTPSCCASAWPSSIWKPGGFAVLLANGSEFGCAQRLIEPRSRIAASVRADAGPREQQASDASIAKPSTPRRRAGLLIPAPASVSGCT